LLFWHCCPFVASQSPSLPHSGAHRPIIASPASPAGPKSQCWAKFCEVGGQSSSRVQGWAELPGRQTFQRGTQRASAAQFVAAVHRGVQNMFPWLSLMQYCGRPSGVGEQSWSSWHGAQ
jgi:hypothetical protein